MNFPFASPQLVHFSEKLDSIPKAPVLTLFELLTGAIGEQGLKPTVKGNLPLKFCREAAQIYWVRRNIGSIRRLAVSTEKTIFSTYTLPT